MKVGEIWATKFSAIEVRVRIIKIIKENEDGKEWTMVYIEPADSQESLGYMDKSRTIEEMNLFFYKVYDEER